MGINVKDMVFILTITVRVMKVNGLKINNMDKEKRLGQMNPHMKANTIMVSKMEMVLSFGTMVALIKVSLPIIIFKEKVFTIGRMVVDLKGTGFKTKCTDMVCLPGLMEENS